MTSVSHVFRQTDDGVLVAPPGCGLLAVPDFLALVQRCAESGGPVVVDLSEVLTLDIAAFRSLVWARRHCRSRGVHFAVIEPRPGVLRKQEEVVLRDLVPVSRDRAAATEAGPPAQRTGAEPLCVVAACGRPVHAGGRCLRHHQRWLRYRAALRTP